MKGNFKIFETEEYISRLETLGLSEGPVYRKLNDYIYPQLRAHPYLGPNIKKLVGYSPSTWRYRIGKFRIFYIVDSDRLIVYLLTIELRRDAYR